MFSNSEEGFDHVSEELGLGSLVVGVVRVSVSPPIPTSFAVLVTHITARINLWENQDNVVGFSIFV